MRAGLLPFVVLGAGLQAQVFDHVYQPGLDSRYSGVTGTASGDWVMVGHLPYNNSFFSTATLMRFSSNGEMLEQHDHAVPGHELTMFSCISELGTDTFLIAGTTSIGCDFGPFLGLLMAWHGGEPLWVRTYGGEDGWTEFASMAVGDSTILLPMHNGVLITSHLGDSLGWMETDWSYIRAARAIAGHFVTVGSAGLRRFDENGTAAGLWPDSALFDVSGHPDGGYVAVARTGLVRLDIDLQMVGAVVPLDLPLDGSHRSITWSDGRFHVLSDSLLHVLDTDLNLLATHPVEHPDGFGAMASLVANGTACAVGSFNCGATGAAVRTLSVTGELPTHVLDIALHGVTPTDLVYTVYPNTMINYVSGTFHAGAWLVNHGEDTLTRATVDQYLPWGICGPAGATYPMDGLMLAPGDSAWITQGPFFLTAYVDTGLTEVERPVCLWAASPNARPDAHRTDNEGCAMVTLWLALAEEDPLRTVSAYPNPFAGTITIDGLPASEDVRIELCDALGRVVHRTDRIDAGGNWTVYPSGLAGGPYVLRIHMGPHRRDLRMIHLE